MMAVISIVFYGLKMPYFELYYFLYQGVLVNPYIFIRYVIVYRSFRAFQKGILMKYASIFSTEETNIINRTILEVRTVFAYICQMLAI